MTTKQLIELREVCTAIIEAVAIAGKAGAPSGILYAALMQTGCSLNQFQSLMAGIVATGKIRQEGNLYFAV